MLVVAPNPEMNDQVGRAESRWPPAVAVLIFVVLNTGLRIVASREAVIGVPWLAPLVEIVLLGVLVSSNPLGVDRRSRWFRQIEITLVLLLLAPRPCGRP